MPTLLLLQVQLCDFALTLFFRGIPPYDNATTVYVHASPGILSSAKILKYSDFRSSRTPEELFTGALDFNAVNEFLFATKQGVGFYF